MSVMFYLGAAVTIGLIVLTGWLSGRKVKNDEEFNRGSAGLGLTVGCILGTIVGGSSTIGTAQLAFNYGFSACWFTLGSGISLLLMALFTSDRLRNRGVLTISGLIGSEYGEKARTVNALLNTFGVTVNIISQILSGTALTALLFPGLSLTAQTACIACLMLLYIVFGGIKSVSTAGMVKTLLIFPAMFICAFFALKDAGGAAVFTGVFPKEQYFSLFARGIKTDSGAALSTVLGVLTTQAYMQAVMSACGDRSARIALFFCAAIVIPLGVAGVAVGLYMRYITPAEVLAVPELAQAAAKTALPTFIQSQFSPFFSGLILSILLITVIGSGASLALSACTVIKRDIVDRLTPRFREGKKALGFSRALVIILLTVTAVCMRFFNSYIVDVAFFSFGFRAASTFAPLICTLFFSGKVPDRYAIAAMGAGVGTVLLVKFAGSPVDPSIAGVVLSLIIMAAGLISGRRDGWKLPPVK